MMLIAHVLKWTMIIFAVSQGSILGPLLFNICICDVFMFLPKDDIADYADDNTPYSTCNGIYKVVPDLEEASGILPKWFIDDYLKTNLVRFHALYSETSDIQLIKMTNY